MVPVDIDFDFVRISMVGKLMIRPFTAVDIILSKK